jgi:CheY-like chemotaxis protein
VTEKPVTVAVINTSEDTTDMLRMAFERAGLVVVAAFTHQLRDSKVDIEVLVRQHRPDVIMYDIALPYDANWRLFEHIRASPACQGIPFVITTTNAAQVRKIVGSNEPMHEIVGKPYDLNVLVQLIRNAAATGGKKASDERRRDDAQRPF